MATALERLQAAADDGSLGESADLQYLLYAWRRLDPGADVRGWVTAQLARNEFVVAFADDAVGGSHSQSMGFGGLGDLVATPHEYVDSVNLAEVVDVPCLRERVNTLLEQADLSEADREKLARFRNAPEPNRGLRSAE